MKKLLFLMVILLQTCTDQVTEENLIGTKIRVNSYKESCMGILPQKCYLIQEGKAIGGNGWQLFYDPIEGFDYTEGFVYDLDVTILEIENPPQDTSGLRYILNKVLSKTKVD